MLYAQETLDFLLKQFNDDDIPYISVDSLQQNTDCFYLLDSRERKEFEVSHLKNAVFIGYNSFDEDKLSEVLIEKDKPIAVYCSLGVRSYKIAKKIKKLGFSKVFNVYGGIFEWKNKGFPVVDPSNKETEKVHAYSRIWGIYLNKGEKVYE
jgi:rhodanese-related sulfurtransferase